MSQTIDLEMIAMQVIIAGGNARAEAHEALKLAKQERFAEADAKLEAAEVELAKAHNIQTEMIQAEAGGAEIPVKLLMVHAQDHYMSAMSVLYLTRELVEVYKKLAA